MQSQPPPDRKKWIFIAVIIALVPIAFMVSFFWPILKDLHHARQNGNHGSKVPLLIFGVFFLVMILAMLVTVIRAIRRPPDSPGAAVNRAADSKPWLARADWAAGKIKSSAMAQPKIYLLMALGACGMGGIGTTFLPEELHKGNYAALTILIFPLVGIGFLVAFISAWRSRLRYGECFFEPAQIPIPLGGTFDGMIQTGKPLKLEHGLHLKLSCIREVAAGKETHEYILWQDEKVFKPEADLPEPAPGHTGIPVHFKLPDDQPECFTRGNVSVFWQLEAKARMSGPDFRALFDVPVFKIAGATAEDADEADPTAALQEPVEEMRRDESSKIQVTDGPDGRELYFPASRNWKLACWATLGMLFSDAIMAAVINTPIPVFWKIFVGIFALLTTWSCFGLWFANTRITINSTGVRVVNRWLFFARTHTFDAGEIARFETGVQQDIQLFTKAGKQITIADGVADKLEADWLAKEMAKALGCSQ